MPLDWKLCTLRGRRKAELQDLADNIPPAYQPEGLPLTTVKGLTDWINEARANYWDAKQDEKTETYYPPTSALRAPRPKAKPRLTTPEGSITASEANAFLARLDASPDGVERGQGQGEQE